MIYVWMKLPTASVSLDGVAGFLEERESRRRRTELGVESPPAAACFIFCHWAFSTVLRLSMIYCLTAALPLHWGSVWVCRCVCVWHKSNRNWLCERYMRIYDVKNICLGTYNVPKKLIESTAVQYWLCGLVKCMFSMWSWLRIQS